jgi:hypothetical protein
MSVVKLKGMPSYEIFGKFYDAVMGDGSESATRVSELIRVSRPREKGPRTRVRNWINTEAFAGQL